MKRVIWSLILATIWFGLDGNPHLVHASDADCKGLPQHGVLPPPQQDIGVCYFPLKTHAYKRSRMI